MVRVTLARPHHRPAPPDTPLPVFVYGTLRHEFGDFRRALAASGARVDTATLPGAALFDNQQYPIAVLTDHLSDVVVGDLLTLDRATYAEALARLERHSAASRVPTPTDGTGGGSPSGGAPSRRTHGSTSPPTGWPHGCAPPCHGCAAATGPATSPPPGSPCTSAAGTESARTTARESPGRPSTRPAAASSRAAGRPPPPRLRSPNRPRATAT